jgi:hypothetical protein
MNNYKKFCKILEQLEKEGIGYGLSDMRYYAKQLGLPIPKEYRNG